MPMLRLTAPTWKLRAIWGRAVAMMVPSRFSMKNAPAIRVVTYRGERGVIFSGCRLESPAGAWASCR